jgi:CheY-like chemotaxis protein
VVEDEAPLRELVVEILQQYGYQTLAANNGAHGLEVWEKNRQVIDLVLTDVMMPEGVSGRDLAERVLSDNPSTKVVYTSGYPMDVLGEDFFQKEGVTFLQKPYHPQTLARVVRECLDA